MKTEDPKHRKSIYHFIMQIFFAGPALTFVVSGEKVNKIGSRLYF